ncbi:intracellular serine protease [Oxobacter pfennigii]|uniref:Intracellular serine protease n=1 Tax=Oxobacter pfennigii TaxID=36849 RepID=A0A0P8WSD5_9CLOT|nr:S8 family serine peptidase [Oxobacter pfennigii]KPU45502.1 intracellular serine protease [Oxobacter pfennigii]
MRLKEVSDLIGADYVKNKGEGVRIAVFDTGFTPHGAVKNVVTGVNFTNDNDGNREDYTDGHSHGTHITGIISYLVPESEIYICKILNNNMMGLSFRICDAIDYCIENNIKIINMSFVTTVDSKLTRDYIKKAIDNDIMIVAAAGNSEDIAYPASYDKVVSVGVWNPYGRYKENQSREVDIIAPGISIMSCSIHGGYIAKSGSSQAAPIVTAAAGKLLCESKEMSRDELYERLMECRRFRFIRSRYGGIIDLSKNTRAQSVF